MPESCSLRRDRDKPGIRRARGVETGRQGKRKDQCPMKNWSAGVDGVSSAAPPQPEARLVAHLPVRPVLDGLRGFLQRRVVPCSYVGPAPPLSAQAAASSSAPASALASDAVLVRWQSRSSRYAAERLSLSFLRCGAEFAPLPLHHQQVGKKVLVRDLLEDMDFEGISFWLATIQAPPVIPPPPAAGKKRTAAAASVPVVQVACQNSIIFVLPKVKGTLRLVAEESAEEEGAETEDEQEEQQRPPQQQHRAAPQLAHPPLPGGAEEGELQSDEEGKEPDARLRTPAGRTDIPLRHSPTPMHGDSTVPTSASASASVLGSSDDPMLAASSPHPFAFSSPTASARLELDDDDGPLHELSPPVKPISATAAAHTTDALEVGGHDTRHVFRSPHAAIGSHAMRTPDSDFSTGVHCMELDVAESPNRVDGIGKPEDSRRSGHPASATRAQRYSCRQIPHCTTQLQAALEHVYLDRDTTFNHLLDFRVSTVSAEVNRPRARAVEGSRTQAQASRQIYR